MRTYKFRIYPSKKQETQMKEHLWIEKNLWNTLLESNKKKYDETGKFLTKSEMQIMVKNSGLYSQVAQTLSHRLQRALWRMVKMRKQGKECGYPRFKNIDRIKSLNYPQSGFSLNKKLKVTPFGEINIKKHREIEGEVKTLTLKRESSGKWFATFCVGQERKEPRINNGEQIGIDLGLKTFATISNGEVIQNPRHLERHEENLAKLQRELSNKKKVSNNRKKAKLKVARLHEKVSNTRADFLHKTSTRIVNDYSFIALEKLASKEMSKQNLGKSINDAGWNVFANMISYKAEEAGCKIVFVDPKNTTQGCSNCHEIVKKELSDRIHDCPFCGLVIDRDLNAAKNILIRATAGQAGSNACGDGATVPSGKQEAYTF
ncbi:MAG: IS200/IS605 family element transposase accessory protein TnpB [Candidatus Aenigmarchaeota archaeon]|nr:IS200/IS605 family element transposase accessory protein TnpB [Candidatus Aenigmarchaeota archaeon]